MTSKTALQQLIDYLDPIHESIRRKAEDLLEVEARQIEEAYIKGRSDEGYLDHHPEKHAQEYYRETYGKKL